MKLKFLEKRQETPGVYSFFFQPESGITWAPGQYMHYVLPHPDADDRGMERWFTISSAPFEKQIGLTTRLASDKSSSFKQALMRIKPGDELEADGPKGKFILQEGDHKHILIAGGIGITPYRPMLVQLDHAGEQKSIELLYANRDDHLVFGNFFKQFEAKVPAFHLRTFIGSQKINDSDLESYVSDASTVFYLSGPRAMVESYQSPLETAGLDEQRIKTDYFPGY